MNLFGDIKGAGNGWSAILSGRGDWRAHFALTPEGLNRAFGVFFVTVFFGTIIIAMRFGVPSPDQLLFLAFGYVMPVIALWIVCVGTIKLANSDTSLIAALVPGLYVEALVVVLGIVLQIVGLQLGGALMGIMAFLMFRFARVVFGLSLWGAALFTLVKVVFSVAPVVLLVFSLAQPT